MNANRKVIELRAELKTLVEQRADLEQQMNDILAGAKKENRAFNDEEAKNFDTLEKQINSIDATIKAEKRARKLTNTVTEEEEKEERASENTDEAELRAFASYIRGTVEERADVNLTVSDNGAVIPTSIAKKIITKVVDMCPVFELADRYSVGGKLSIPAYDEDSQAITMAYATEFSDLTSTSGKFTSIELDGYLAGALTKVSKSLINNSDFDLVSFVVERMAQAIALFVEKELLIGTSGKVTGLSGLTAGVTTTSATAITADELIEAQETVPDAYQSGAIWIMNRATRTAIRKLKDGQGNYLLNRDYSAKWGYTLLGKDVYTSDNMPTMAAGKTVIYYGDMQGLAVKLAEDVNIEVLREVYAAQHALGIVGWVELDSKVENAQMLTALKMKSAS